MSYTFSRRDFMKYTALTAVAIAGSGMLTGCSNPNQPTGTVGSPLKPGGGICEATLLNGESAPTYDAAQEKLVCNFKIAAKVDALQVDDGHFQIDVTTSEKTSHYYYKNQASTGVTLSVDGGNNAMKKGEVLNPVVLTVNGLDLTNATSVAIRYTPKHSAKENGTDLYNDVYATWYITDAIKNQIPSDTSLV